ncbi:MAG: hypothetical protein IT385_08095, partial [Deltaproteobacteria bacterium]|nr:hypothetical protein [Deltaproteobacteria bacterium]
MSRVSVSTRQGSPAPPGLLANSWSERIGALLERFDVRVALSLAILASLVPHRHEATTDLIFLGLFGLELALRVIALIGARRGDEPDVRATRRGLRAWLLLALDVVALLTFVPAVSDLLG